MKLFFYINLWLLPMFVGFLEFGPCFVMQYLMPFLVFNHLAEEERAGCFSLIGFLLSCGSK